MAADTNGSPDQKLKEMVTFGTRLFAVPKAEYDEREAKRKNRKKTPPKNRPN